MRHLAYLHATPEGSKKSRLASLMELDENSSFLQFPDIEGAEYLVGLLSEAGFVSHTGMGAVSLSWLEIDAWLRCTHTDISVWEKITLKEMSEVYASELVKAAKKDATPPYVQAVKEDDVQEKRTQIASKIRNVFSSFKRNPEPVVEE